MHPTRRLVVTARLNTKSSLGIMFSLCLLCALTQSLSAEWLLLDDFEDYTAESQLDYPITGSATATLLAREDPLDPENQTAYVTSGPLINTVASFFNFSLPQEIPVNGKGTIFLRLYDPGPHHEIIIAAGKLPASEAGDIDLSTGLDEMTCIVFDTESENEAAYLRSWNSGYLNANPTFGFPTKAWTSVWIIIDNRYGDSGEVLGGMEVYVQGPQEEEPRLLTWGSRQIASMGFRDTSMASIKTFSVALRNEATWMYLDDLYMATEPCLSNPALGEPCASWCGFPVANGDYASTGDWLGWIWTGLCDTPPGWVYSQKYDRWLWIDSCPPAGERSWVYLPMVAVD